MPTAAAPTADDYTSGFDAQLNLLRQRLAAVPTSNYSPEQIGQRQAANERDYQLGLLGMLSGDPGLQGVGGMVYKQAIAGRTPHVTEKGMYDPITGAFTLNPQAQQEAIQAAMDRVQVAKAQAQREWLDNRQKAQERADQAQQQRDFMAGQHALTRAMATDREPLVQVLDPATGQPVYVLRSNAVGMTPAPTGGGQPSESERKAASLLQRLQFSQQQVQDVLAQHPEATMPSRSAETVRGLPLVGETAANVASSAARQQVDAAQLDMLDAALTLGTGAAYTKEQLRGYQRSYFPQIGDEPATIAAKNARLQNIVDAARIAAGRAAPQGAQAAQGSQPGAPQVFKQALGAGGGAGAVGGAAPQGQQPPAQQQQRFRVDF
jgi:hypothetical protein